MNKRQIIAYTDGACSNNGKVNSKGGIGFLILKDDQVLIGRRAYDGVTNNQMELLAVIRVLELLASGKDIVLYTDSKYVTDSVNLDRIERWRRCNWTRNGDELKNRSLWERLYYLITEKHNVTLIWVKGHASNVYNNLCDAMARKSIIDKVYKEETRLIPVNELKTLMSSVK